MLMISISLVMVSFIFKNPDKDLIDGYTGPSLDTLWLNLGSHYNGTAPEGIKKRGERKEKEEGRINRG